MFEKSKQHLEDSETTYLEHMIFAIKAGFMLLIAGVASIIHAILPQLFPGTAAFTVIRLYKQRLENHPNPIYKEKIKDEINN